MRFRQICYRAHDPKWAFSPVSGEGAKTYGGRFNPKGVAALYLALTTEGMFCEMGHGLAYRFSPLTVCSYDVDVEDIVDLREESGRAAYGIALADLSCPWLDDLANKRRPASWKVAQDLIEKDAAGILVPSFAYGARPDMANLVLWKWADQRPYLVRVHDPKNQLPKDQASWA